VRPLSEQDPEVTRQLVSVLSRVDELRERYGALESGPVPGSLAADDAASSLGELSWLYATASWATGSDHLISWQRIIAGGMQPLAANYTLCRVALEGAVLCRWLVEAKASPIERRRRGIAMEMEDLRHTHNFEAALGIDKDPRADSAESPARRRVELQAMLRVLNINEPAKPNVTRLFDDYLSGVVPGKGTWVYRLLSAFVHGGPNLMGAMSEREEIGSLGSDVALMLMTASPKYSLMTTQIAVASMEVALRDLETYAGR
jgi:hypothetical protein